MSKLEKSLAIELIDDENASFCFYKGECLGCELFDPLDYMRLCEACSGKFERDVRCNSSTELGLFSFAIWGSSRATRRAAPTHH